MDKNEINHSNSKTNKLKTIKKGKIINSQMRKKKENNRKNEERKNKK